MPYRVNKKFEPQFNLLLIATVVSVLIWVASWYLPFAGYIVYPLQLFATFVHEGSHVLATLLTGNTVQSLTVSSDGSGAVWSQTAGWLPQLFISSAGYLGTTLFGTLLLCWIRAGWSAKAALFVSAGFVGLTTVAFGLFAPVFNFFSNVTLGSVFFTVFSGAVLAGALVLIGYFANARWANFALAFLAVQSLLNAVFSLVDLLLITTTVGGHSDAVNMSAATGIPALVWVLIWFGVSIFMISVGLRLYALRKGAKHSDSVFTD
jgi:hypothetical protein